MHLVPASQRRGGAYALDQAVAASDGRGVVRPGRIDRSSDRVQMTSVVTAGRSRSRRGAVAVVLARTGNGRRDSRTSHGTQSANSTSAPPNPIAIGRTDACAVTTTGEYPGHGESKLGCATWRRRCSGLPARSLRRRR